MSEQIINADTLPPSKGLFQERWAILKRNSMAYASFWFLIALFAFAIMGKVLTQNIVVFDPKTVRLSEKFLPPLTPYTSKISAKEDAPVMGVYLLGTDELGRDVFARMMEGSFVSLTVGFVAVGISLTVGIFFGGLAGFYGRVKLGFVTVDTLIMRFVDIMLCFPSFFLILTVVALLPPSIYNIMIVIGLTSWMGIARFVRAEFFLSGIRILLSLLRARRFLHGGSFLFIWCLTRSPRFWFPLVLVWPRRY